MRPSRLALLFVFALAFALPGASPGVAQVVAQPQPQTFEVQRNQQVDDAALLRRLQGERDMPSGKIEGYVSIPDKKEGVLVQPQGRTFRDVRTRFQPWFDAALIVIAVGSMAALYVFAGPLVAAKDPQGRKLKRFHWHERFVHWLTASTFIWLALTGLNLVFGRYLLIPLIGGDAFSVLSHYAKLTHNSVGIAFTIGLVLMAVQWFWNNLPSRHDIAWIKTAGGYFGGPHVPTEKFNAGQKMIYWIAVFGGGLVAVTGILLMLPFAAVDVVGMQIVHGVHSVIAALMIAVIIGHIYLGSVGVPGSFQAMSTGRVDLNWAREHHSLWAEKEEARGRVLDGDGGPVGPARPQSQPHPAE